MSALPLFACRGCDFRCEVTWHPGLCPSCFRRWDIKQVRVVADHAPLVVEDGERVCLCDVAEEVEDVKRIGLGGDLAGVDHVLGGGLVPGSVVLLAGAPGIGKSTLTLQTLARVAQSLPALYFSAEEAVSAVASRARRLGCELDARLQIVREADLERIKDHIVEAEATVVAIDSLQMISCASPTTGDPLEPGSAMSVGVSVAALTAFAQEEQCCVLLIGRVTRDGGTSGPRGGLDHQVDTVMTFAGNPKRTTRTLTVEKNRFGATARVSATFEMTATGLVPRAEKKRKGPSHDRSHRRHRQPRRKARPARSPRRRARRR
jgi:DNA repair protein RadA/Sms